MKDWGTHISMFVSVEVEKILRESQPQFWKRLVEAQAKGSFPIEKVHN